MEVYEALSCGTLKTHAQLAKAFNLKLKTVENLALFLKAGRRPKYFQDNCIKRRKITNEHVLFLG